MIILQSKLGIERLLFRISLGNRIFRMSSLSNQVKFIFDRHAHKKEFKWLINYALPIPENILSELFLSSLCWQENQKEAQPIGFKLKLMLEKYHFRLADFIWNKHGVIWWVEILMVIEFDIVSMMSKTFAYKPLLIKKLMNKTFKRDLEITIRDTLMESEEDVSFALSICLAACVSNIGEELENKLFSLLDKISDDITIDFNQVYKNPLLQYVAKKKDVKRLEKLFNFEIERISNMIEKSKPDWNAKKIAEMQSFLNLSQCYSLRMPPSLVEKINKIKNIKME